MNQAHPNSCVYAATNADNCIMLYWGVCFDYSDVDWKWDNISLGPCNEACGPKLSVEIKIETDRFNQESVDWFSIFS